MKLALSALSILVATTSILLSSPNPKSEWELRLAEHCMTSFLPASWEENEPLSSQKIVPGETVIRLRYVYLQSGRQSRGTIIQINIDENSNGRIKTNVNYDGDQCAVSELNIDDSNLVLAQIKSSGLRNNELEIPPQLIDYPTTPMFFLEFHSEGIYRFIGCDAPESRLDEKGVKEFLDLLRTIVKAGKVSGPVHFNRIKEKVEPGSPYNSGQSLRD